MSMNIKSITFLQIIATLVFFSFQVFANEETQLEEKPSSQISNDQYRAGAVVGTVVGFGMGHLTKVQS